MRIDNDNNDCRDAGKIDKTRLGYFDKTSACRGSLLIFAAKPQLIRVPPIHRAYAL
jgi:hypothetical protein